MTITQHQAQLVAEFRAWLDQRFAADDRYAEPQRFDRADGSTLTTRWPIGNRLMLEVTVRPLIPQVRVGIVTDDRWRSGEIEDAIETSGDSMSEFLEVALAEVGLDWSDPPVEHYREQGKWFSFATPVELQSLDELADAALRGKICQVVDAYACSYGAL